MPRASGSSRSPTRAGRRSRIASEKGEQAPWEQVRSGAPAESVQLGNSFKQLAAATSQAFRAADEGQRARIRELLDETRRGIYGILAEKD